MNASACGNARCPLHGVGQPATEPGRLPRCARCQCLLPGVTLGTYRLGAVLGEGGFGTVYTAQHTSLGNEEVALKIVSLDGGRAQAVEELTIVLQEARALLRVRHPGCVTLRSFWTQPDGRDGRLLACLVMDLARGRSLEQLCAQAGPLGLERALGLTEQILEALAAVHDAGLVFRDLKPANILVLEGAAGADRVTLVDFGLAQRAGGQPNVGGTEGYMSPEQAYVRVDLEARQALVKQLDGRSDLYAAGRVLFRMLSGKRLSELSPAAGPGAALPRLTSDPVGWGGVDDLIAALTAADRNDRPADARAAIRWVRSLMFVDVRVMNERLKIEWHGRLTGSATLLHLRTLLGASRENLAEYGLVRPEQGFRWALQRAPGVDRDIEIGEETCPLHSLRAHAVDGVLLLRLLVPDPEGGPKFLRQTGASREG